MLRSGPLCHLEFQSQSVSLIPTPVVCAPGTGTAAGLAERPSHVVSSGGAGERNPAPAPLFASAGRTTAPGRQSSACNQRSSTICLKNLTAITLSRDWRHSLRQIGEPMFVIERRRVWQPQLLQLLLFFSRTSFLPQIFRIAPARRSPMRLIWRGSSDQNFSSATLLRLRNW